MKHLKIFGLAAVAAMAMTALGASSASATTLEINGVKQTGPVTFSASLASGTKALVGRTDTSHVVDCALSAMHGTTKSPFTGSVITAPLTTLTFSSCSSEPVVVHQAGQIYIEHISGTTDGWAYSENAVITVPTTFGFTVTCSTGGGTKIGRLTGKAAGNATLDINAVLNCGFLLPSAEWTGTYILTTPSGLGIAP